LDLASHTLTDEFLRQKRVARTLGIAPTVARLKIGDAKSVGDTPGDFEIVASHTHHGHFRKALRGFRAEAYGAERTAEMRAVVTLLRRIAYISVATLELGHRTRQRVTVIGASRGASILVSAK
jgi:hypothetical protein